MRGIFLCCLLSACAGTAILAQQGSTSAHKAAPQVAELKQQATRAVALNHYADAARLLARAFVQDPADADLSTSLEIITSKEGAAETALPILDKALIAKPREDSIRLALAQCYQHLEQDEKAIATLSGGTTNATQSPLWLFTTAFSLFRIGEYSQAEEIFRRVSSVENIQPAADFFIGNCRFGQGDLAGALPWYQSAIQLGESRATSALNAYYYNYGLALFRLERYRDASNAFYKASSLNPADPLAPYFLGRSQALSGELEDAVAILNKVTVAHPDFGPAFLQLGLLYKRTGKQEQAKLAFAKISQIKAAELEDQRLLGQMRLNGDQARSSRVR